MQKFFDYWIAISIIGILIAFGYKTAFISLLIFSISTLLLFIFYYLFYLYLKQKIFYIKPKAKLTKSILGLLFIISWFISVYIQKHTLETKYIIYYIIFIFFLGWFLFYKKTS
ncbi:MAG: hypothetical protein KatS3mg129_1304 [Leptospiraceae bacterium]|nr:MAG: hypothetical protein KatS3mg129_1304 [Leptospiraceae bacterium]